MFMIGMLATGIGMFVAGAVLIAKSKPLSEKETIEKICEEREFELKKEKLMPMRNADINLFGVLRY